MVDALTKSLARKQAAADGRAKGAVDYRKRISDHVAFGLLVYTGLHIFVTMGALKTGKGNILPYFSLIVLVAAIIPACRWFEKRWEGLSDAEAGDPALAGAFHRDVAMIWAGALCLPVVLTLFAKAALALF
ncbi:hypothetical protein [Aurantiacibacter xanthus]|uniref:hypothetical protein n=1 Tax=Aurantiacibacter xanthus TaxID=1784712 RepID=UPI001FE38640|nr:hypothetical protein [Aurantiacibacter xanthus]